MKLNLTDRELELAIDSRLYWVNHREKCEMNILLPDHNKMFEKQRDWDTEKIAMFDKVIALAEYENLSR